MSLAPFDEARQRKYLQELTLHAEVCQAAIDRLRQMFGMDDPFAATTIDIFSAVHTFLGSSAMISKMLWPPRRNDDRGGHGNPDTQRHRQRPHPSDVSGIGEAAGCGSRVAQPRPVTSLIGMGK